MRKFAVTSAALVLALMPLAASAATFVARDEYSSGPQDRFAGNAYIFAGSSSVGAQVVGDLFITGGSVSVTGAVGGDIAAAGGSLQLQGPVAGDVRAAGGQIAISGRVRGDLDVAGGTIHLLSGAVVDGDVSVVGGQLILDGAVNGSVTTKGGSLVINGRVTGPVNAKLGKELTLGTGARIDGALTYSAPQEAVIGSGAKIGGPISYEPSRRAQHGSAKGVVWAALGVVIALKTLAFLGLAALIVWRWRRQATEVLQEAKDTMLPSLGRGFAYLILVPMAAVLLLVSFVGTIAGALLMAAYIALLSIAAVMAGMYFGAGLEMVLRKNGALHVTWGNALGGVILLALVSLIPVVGWIVGLVLTMTMFGVLAHRSAKRL